MDELRTTHGLQRPTQSPTGRRTTRTETRLSRLGQTLREAREEKGLELRDLAVLTNVRVMHLEALEQGDFHNLPEDPYGKNFVRLYAQAVGLEPSRTLLLYGQEKRAAAGAAPTRAAPPSLELPSSVAEARARFDNPRLVRLGGLLVSLLLVVGVVLLALWGFNRLMSRGGSSDFTTPSPATESSAAPDSAPATTAAPVAASQPDAASPGMVLLSLRTTPPGAEVSIDGYPFGQSPITDAPIRAGQRTLEITRAGYRPYQGTLELSGNRRLNFVLTPTNGAVPTAPDAATGQAANQVTVAVLQTAWLEIYAGAARGQGERLVYETANPGDTFVFSAPVYVYSGNASGVSVTRNGLTRPLGDGVTGQAYPTE